MPPINLHFFLKFKCLNHHISSRHNKVGSELLVSSLSSPLLPHRKKLFCMSKNNYPKDFGLNFVMMPPCILKIKSPKQIPVLACAVYAVLWERCMTHFHHWCTRSATTLCSANILVRGGFFFILISFCSKEHKTAALIEDNSPGGFLSHRGSDQ